MQAPPYPGFMGQPYGGPMPPQGEQGFPGYPAPRLMYGGPHGMSHFGQGLPQLEHQDEHEEGESEVYDDGDEEDIEGEDSCSADELSSVASKPAQSGPQAAHTGEEAAEVDENESTQKRRMTRRNRFDEYQNASAWMSEKHRWKANRI